MGKLLLALDALRKGSMLADPALWKNRTGAIVAITALMAVLIKIAKVYGYDIPITDEELVGVAGTIVTFVSLYFNYATSSKVGLLPPKSGPEGGVPAGSEASTSSPGDMHGNP